MNNECKCPTNALNISGKCFICPSNSIVDNNLCKCKTGSFKQGSLCVICGVNQYFNGNVCAPCINGRALASADNMQIC